MYNQVICLRAKHGSCLFGLLFVRGNHVFKSAAPTLSQLEDHLIKSAVYNNGLVVVDKPVGICFERGLVGSDSLNPSRDVCLKSALPALQDHFKIKQLYNLKIPERNISGVTIFAESEGLVKEVLKWWKVLRDRKEGAEVYHTIVVGQPHKNSGHFNGTISLKSKNGIKRVMLSEKIGHNAVKRREEKRICLDYRTLSSCGDASLVEVQTTCVKWNSVRVYLASQVLTPVLGDSLYGMYVKTLLGAPVPVDIFSKPKLPAQKLPENLKKRLEIATRKDIAVPLHLHLSLVRLMVSKRQGLEYSMPHPQVFGWTMEQLGLNNQPVIAASSAV